MKPGIPPLQHTKNTLYSKMNVETVLN